MKPSGFVHLRLHTEYSLVDGLVRLKPLMKALPEKGMNTIAVTDFCNLFATVKVFQAAMSAGIKPIIGSDFICHDGRQTNADHTLVLLCQNDIGYRNLTRLVSLAYQEGQQQGKPRLLFDWVARHAEGLIALSGGLTGEVGQALLANDEPKARDVASRWATCFPGRFYLEIQRTGRAQESDYNARVVQLADALNLPLVATNDVRFLEEDDFDAHEARVCIHEGYTLGDERRQKRYSPEQYLRSADEMVALFEDLPQAIENTVEIGQRCNVRLTLGKNYLPNFPTPEGVSVDDFLSQLAKKGLEARFEYLFREHGISTQQRATYEARLQTELAVIQTMGFAGYFLIVADFIQWAKQNGVPVGPGRGSGAGSLVAYALMITDLDPLQYELLFERFLNPERVSMPDFDIDFCMEGRDRVIDYVAQKYGRQSVSQIITFGTMAAKAVIRDVGRVLGHPYGFVDPLAKLVPFEVGITLTEALEKEDELRRRYQDEDDVKTLLDLALSLEGITRNAGKHAGGVVIAPSELTDFTAIYCEEGSAHGVSQFDKDDVEAVGLVKFDFLGLRTLTIIDWTLQTIRQRHPEAALTTHDLAYIPLDDTLTFDLLKACHTTAVFQLESRGMKELIHRLQPDCFEEIIALVALFRPGPLQSGMVDDFIDRKHGRAVVEYPHPDLEFILKPTYGVILYQEQVMQIAQVLANFTLGGADLLRRAMGKKKPEEMAEQRAIFIAGAEARGVETQTATLIFDLMEKFAGYGFNKSHSAAYALIAYQTAWLKAHYPAAFMAAVISSDMDNTEKVVGLLQECTRMGLTVLPPSLNQSHATFTVWDEQTLIYGLAAIKGVGTSAIQCLIEAREQGGDFVDIYDVCQRVDTRKVNRRVLEVLIKSGSMDGFGMDRALLLVSLERALQVGAQFHQQKQTGQADLFGLFDEPSVAEVSVQPWSERTRLNFEKETLGLYLTGHPANLYLQEFRTCVQPMSELNPARKKRAITCGMVTHLRKIVTKGGRKLVIVTLEDADKTMDIVVFSKVFEPKAEEVVVGQLLVIEGELSQDTYTGGVKVTANALYGVADARTRFAKCLVIHLGPEQGVKLEALKALLEAYSGGCLVQFHYTNIQAKAHVNVPWRVTPSEALLAALTTLLGEEKVMLSY